MFTVKEEKNSEPLIYLYNTHQSEKYQSLDNLEYNPSIMTVTNYIKEKLNEKGLITIMENRSIGKVLEENNWNYSSSYRASRIYLNSVKEEYPSVKYYFDFHRDSGSKAGTTLCVSDKCYAKILFLIGLENENFEENQKYAETLSEMLNEKVNGLSKGILQKKGKGVNGVYNEDFSNRTILIEIGGEKNSINEVYNTANVLVDVIEEYIKKEI